MGQLSGLRRQVSVARNALRMVVATPQLFIYPLLFVVVGLGWLAALVVVGVTMGITAAQVGILTYLVGFPVAATVLMVGYCYELNEVFCGRRPGVGSGLRRAVARNKMVVIGGLVFGVGGLALHYVGESVPFGNVIGVGSRWGLRVASVFAFPAVAIGHGSLRETITEVRHAAEAHWGKSLLATVGTQAIAIVLFWTGMGLAVLLAVLAALGIFAIELPPLGGYTLSVVLPIVALATSFLVHFTVDGVVKTALYRYAMDDSLPPGLSSDAEGLLADATDSGSTARAAGSTTLDR